MTMRRRIPVLAALALSVLGSLTVAGPARAADPVTVGLSGAGASGTGSDSAISGVLTLRSRAAVEVDPAGLVVRVDGAPRAVSVTQAPHEQRRAMLVIDTSGSMGPSGMATVRAAAAQFLGSAPADVMVGVTSFADTAGVDLAPTRDRAAVQRVVDGLASRGNTSLYAAVEAATSALGTRGDRSILLLSDGADTTATNGAVALSRAVAHLQSAGVRVDVVRFKTDDADATMALRRFADANGGAVVPASDTGAVAAAFRTSAQALDQQVQFVIRVPGIAPGSHRVEMSGLAGATRFAFRWTVTTGRAATAPTGGPDPAGVLTPGAAAGSSGNDGTPDTDGAAAAGPLDLAGLASTPRSGFVPWAAAGLLGLGLAVGLVTVSSPTLQTKRERRVAQIEDYVVSRREARDRMRAEQKSIADSLLELGDKVMKDRTSTKTTMALIERADLPLRAGEWLWVRAAVLVASVVGGYLFLSAQPFVGVAVGAALGLVLPPVALRVLAARRAKQFERQLPDVLMLVATSLRSGFGLSQALDAIATDAAEPAAKEFSRALAETRIGTDVTDALEKMGERMDSVSMRWTVMSIRIQRDVGGNLAETLKTTATTLRERESLHRQVLSLSAEGRLSAYILMAMPVGLFFWMLKANYEYVSLLWTDPIGMAMSATGVCLIIGGAFWMRSVVKIEV